MYLSIVPQHRTFNLIHISPLSEVIRIFDYQVLMHLLQICVRTNWTNIEISLLYGNMHVSDQEQSHLITLYRSHTGRILFTYMQFARANAILQTQATICTRTILDIFLCCLDVVSSGHKVFAKNVHHLALLQIHCIYISKRYFKQNFGRVRRWLLPIYRHFLGGTRVCVNFSSTTSEHTLLNIICKANGLMVEKVITTCTIWCSSNTRFTFHVS